MVLQWCYDGAMIQDTFLILVVMMTGSTFNSSCTGSHGGQSPIRLGRRSRNDRIGCAEAFRFATWNCGGLSAMQKTLCHEYNYDILAVTETHDKGDFKPSSNTILGEAAPENDKASGVCLLLSQRISRCVIYDGNIGSRLVFARIRAAICNIFVICVYIPHSKHQNPCAEDTISQLDSLLGSIPPTDCVLVLGDLNSKLPRSYDRLTGKWCVHTLPDNHGGAKAILELMRKYQLVAASTLHQPRRGHTNATFMPRDNRYKPRQLDYILCSSRWISSVCSSRVRWGPSIQRWGRIYDHGLVECRWRTRLIAPKKVHRPDFKALKDNAIALKFEEDVKNSLSSTVVNMDCPTDRLNRLNTATKKAVASLPSRKPTPVRKRLVSQRTRELIEIRAKEFQRQPVAKRQEANREISRSCRDDYRTYIADVVQAISHASDVGNMREVSRLTKSISSKEKSSPKMPSKGKDGKVFTDVHDLLDAWKEFLGNKFSCADRPGAVYNPDINEHLAEEDLVTHEEFDDCVKALHCDRAPGWDGAPIEVYLASNAAYQELYELVCLIWRSETIPEVLVYTLFIMLYKKGSRDDLANYRAIGLLCHSYKVLSVLILKRMQPVLEERLPDSQAGFRKARGCRDNVLILKLIINEIVKAQQEAVITFIDYTAAFDSVSHRFLDESLAESGVAPKVRRIIRAIYSCASGAVRLRQPSGEQICSESFNIRRGAIQGDIYSPPAFTIALDRIFKRHDKRCDGVGGAPLNCPRVSKLEYADDVGLLNENVDDASERLTSLSSGGSADACLEISLKKTKAMPVRKYEPVSNTTEDEITELKLKHKCAACNRTFPTQKGLNIHRARWCNPNGPPRSRKGSLADKAVKHAKKVKQAAELPKVSVNGHELNNVLSFDYLGCRMSGDGDDSADMRQRMNIATDRFASLWNIWRDKRLPIQPKLDLYKKSVCSTFTHGSETWTLKPATIRSVNGFNSRCLHHITGRSYRNEAMEPSFDLVRAIRHRRLKWLGHILRMNPNRLVRQAVTCLAADGPPYPPGSLLMDVHVTLVAAEALAQDRKIWAANITNTVP